MSPCTLGRVRRMILTRFSAGRQQEYSRIRRKSRTGRQTGRFSNLRLWWETLSMLIRTETERWMPMTSFILALQRLLPCSVSEQVSVIRTGLSTSMAMAACSRRENILGDTHTVLLIRVLTPQPTSMTDGQPIILTDSLPVWLLTTPRMPTLPGTTITHSRTLTSFD